MTDEIAYLPGTPGAWAEGVHALAPTRVGGLALVGPCPRCGDAIRVDLSRKLAPAWGLGGQAQHRTEVIRVVCNCPVAHPGAPAGVLGCGAEGGIEIAF